MQKPVENTNDFIRVKRSYIYIPLVIRIVFSIVVFSVLVFVFLVLYLLLAMEFSIFLPFTFFLLPSIVVAGLLSLPVVFSVRILKRFCGRWGYSRFHWVQQLARMLVLLSPLSMLVFFLASQFYESLPLWSLFLYLGLLVTMTYATSFIDFFSLVGVAVLSFKVFLKEFDKKSDEADFGKLAIAAKRISEIAKFYNMQVSPHRLALAMTTSFLNDNEKTRKDFDVLIEWTENSTKQENFKKFRKLVTKYNSIAEKLSKEGITGRYYWTIERIVKFTEVIVVPLAGFIIINVVPKILEMLN